MTGVALLVQKPVQALGDEEACIVSAAKAVRTAGVQIQSAPRADSESSDDGFLFMGLGSDRLVRRLLSTKGWKKVNHIPGKRKTG